MLKPLLFAKRTNLGHSLVELMVALTIGLIILAAVSTIFATSRSTYTLEEGLARTQEAGRFSVEFLAQDIRMAGYTGCNSQVTSINNIAVPSTNAYTLMSGGIRGYRYAGSGSSTNLSDWEPDLPDDMFDAGEVKAGTDVIIIQRGSTLDTSLTGNMGTVNANIQILATASIAGQIAADDFLMISDCKSVDIFRANNVSSGSGTTTISHSSSVNSSNNLSKAYTTQAQLMKFISNAYYIGTGTNGEPSLMRKELSKGAPTTAGTSINKFPPQELVEGIEDMRITYGEDTDADNIPNIYRKADNVSAWDKIVSVRLGLLARTGSTVETTLDTKTYSFDNVTVDPTDDRRRRQFYLTTIQVRN